MESLVVTLQGQDGQKLYTLITELATDHECFLSQGYGLHLGKLFALSMRVSGHWSNIAKLESALENKTDPTLKIIKERTKSVTKEYVALPYSVQVIATNQIGTVYNVCQFFTAREIVIESFHCETFISSISGANMLIITLLLSIPTLSNIAELREEFLLYCEELNIDGILEPEKR